VEKPAVTPEGIECYWDELADRGRQGPLIRTPVVEGHEDDHDADEQS